MISKRELLDAAAALHLGPHIVEKDYALGWLLAGISAHEQLAESWIFKGGTCLKKCFFETYRFSEDLDFTLRDTAHLDEAFLKSVFTEISESIYEECGLEFPPNLQDFDIYDNPRGGKSCQGKLSYRGPLAPSSGGLPRIKLDLTAEERVVLPPVRVPIFHPYADAPGDGIHVLAYAYEEAFGEKFRALGERARPRDLYDVVNLYRNEEARPSAAVLRDVIRQKCEFKGIAVPHLDGLAHHKADLEGTWENMLGHQLPALPAVDDFWNVLPEIFAWLDSGLAPATPVAFTLAEGEQVIRERTFRLPNSGAEMPSLEIIRFAASNRLCVDLDYVDLQGSRRTRRVEPYSLRRTRAGDIILHAHDLDRGHRSYRVDGIRGAQATNQTFVPRHAVELTPQGPLPIASTAGRSGTAFRAPSARSPYRSARSGPVYVYQCSYCGKRFERKTMTSDLNPHKDKNGYPCSGRSGFFIETKYR